MVWAAADSAADYNMLSLFESLNEIRRLAGIKEQKRPTIEEIASEFRSKNYHEVESCEMIGTCLLAAKTLAAVLRDYGYNAKPVSGYYNDVEDEYLKYVNPEDLENDELDDWDNRWKHWWVVVDGTTIVDVTADQFHPSDPSGYEVVITQVGDPSYG